MLQQSLEYLECNLGKYYSTNLKLNIQTKQH